MLFIFSCNCLLFMCTFYVMLYNEEKQKGKIWWLQWLYYLCITQQNAVNVERVSAIKDITGQETLQYVLRTLALLEQCKDKLSTWQYHILERVLQWSEVAKGGLEPQRSKWLEKGVEQASHMTFKPLADSLYYDYEGKKHINVYKKRVIEKYLRNGATEDVKLSVEIRNNTVYVDISFSKVCEKLIDFCVEAERCGLLTYEKSITVLFDMFGFRKDEFDRLNNEDKYLQTMNDSSESTKGTIADFVTGVSVVDVGSGGGIMLDLLEEKYPDKKIIGTDISTNVIEALEKKKSEEGHHWQVVKHNFVEGHFGEKVDTVIFSSILHEVYSYTETENGRFDIETVRLALKNAYDSLKSGGRIVIRDGVKTPASDKLMKVSFKNKAGLSFFQNYAQDFKGLPDVKDNRPTCINTEELYAVGDVNFMREFLYTYTWGNESYSHEVQEQFGYFTLEEYKAFFEEIGAKIIEAREFLEPGYEEHLSELVSLSDAESGCKEHFPNSNCIIVVEK